MKAQKGKNEAKVFKEKEWYREKIVEMVEQIEDVWILEQIHKFVINMTEEGD